MVSSSPTPILPATPAATQAGRNTRRNTRNAGARGAPSASVLHRSRLVRHRGTGSDVASQEGPGGTRAKRPEDRSLTEAKRKEKESRLAEGGEGGKY